MAMKLSWAIQFFLALAMMVSYVIYFYCYYFYTREGKNFKLNVTAL